MAHTSADSVPPLVQDWPKLLLHRSIHWVGSGLLNLGHGSFINAVLQCMSHTPPILNYPHKCKNRTFCPFCEVRKIAGSPHPASPEVFVRNLKVLGRELRRTIDCDPFIFWKLVIEKIPDKEFVRNVFGFKLRTVMTCPGCNAQSIQTTDETAISIDPCHDSIQQCLESRFQEQVSHNNCQVCRLHTTEEYGKVLKAPLVLVVQVSRFGGEGGKRGQKLWFGERVEMEEGVGEGKKVEFELYAVLVHEGTSIENGHSSAFVLTGSGVWYRMDDTQTEPVPFSLIHSHPNAYLLFYKQILVETSSSDPILKLLKSDGRTLVCTVWGLKGERGSGEEQGLGGVFDRVANCY